MDKYEYFGGIPEAGIVPLAPHAGSLLRHVYEQEHGRGGFSGTVTHTYHLYPPNNWIPGETGTLDGAAWAPDWESPLRPVGGVHHALEMMAPPAPLDVYRGMARLIANQTASLSVTMPQAPMDYFFEHHSATLVFFVHRGQGTLETPFGPIGYRRGDFLVVPKGITHRFELGSGPHHYWVYESSAGDPEKAEAPTTGQFLPYSRSDLKYPRSLETRNEAGRFPIVSKIDGAYARRVHPTHPFDVVGWRGAYLPYKLAVEDVRPLMADRSHVPPSAHTVFTMPGCYICVFTVRRAEKEGLWLPFFHRNLDYCETIGYHSGQFFSRGGVVREGMISVHPVGLPHGPHPPGLEAMLDGARPEVFEEVGIMADFANPARISDVALRLSRSDYMASWSAYATAPRFQWRASRLGEAQAAAERLSGERDRLRPADPEGA